MGWRLLPQGHRLPGRREGTSVLSNRQLISELTTVTEQYLAQAEPLLREAGKRRVPKIDIRFDLTGLTAGQVVSYAKKSVIRYNLSIAQRQPEQFIAETVPHEVAHVVTSVLFGKVKPHGKEWRSVMAFFGIAEPERCHGFDLQDVRVRGQRRWPYACDCTTHQLSTTRHYRILRGTQRYLCRKCGRPLRYTGS